MGKFIDLTGQKIGRLKVLKRAPNNKFNQVCWVCLCDCGNTVTVIGTRLHNRKTLSCGCIRKEITKQRNLDTGKAKGASKTRLYSIYKGIKRRLFNQNDASFSNYGGRGIEICREWLDDYKEFERWALKNGYNENLTIDRIDVNGNYCPENCRWVDRKTQSNNKRNNHFITVNGITKTLSEWSDISGVHYYTIFDRISHGWNERDAIFTPASMNKKEGR